MWQQYNAHNHADTGQQKLFTSIIRTGKNMTSVTWYVCREQTTWSEYFRNCNFLDSLTFDMELYYGLVAYQTQGLMFWEIFWVVWNNLAIFPWPLSSEVFFGLFSSPFGVNWVKIPGDQQFLETNPSGTNIHATVTFYMLQSLNFSNTWC